MVLSDISNNKLIITQKFDWILDHWLNSSSLRWVPKIFPSDITLVILLSKIWHKKFRHTFGTHLICRRILPFVAFVPGAIKMSRWWENFQNFIFPHYSYWWLWLANINMSSEWISPLKMIKNKKKVLLRQGISLLKISLKKSGIRQNIWQAIQQDIQQGILRGIPWAVQW